MLRVFDKTVLLAEMQCSPLTLELVFIIARVSLSIACVVWDSNMNSFTVLPAKSDGDFMFDYKVIRDVQSIGHLCINPILRIGLIHKWYIDLGNSSWAYTLVFYLVIVNKLLRHCYSWLAQ